MTLYLNKVWPKPHARRFARKQKCKYHARSSCEILRSQREDLDRTWESFQHVQKILRLSTTSNVARQTCVAHAFLSFRTSFCTASIALKSRRGLMPRTHARSKKSFVQLWPKLLNVSKKATVHNCWKQRIYPQTQCIPQFQFWYSQFHHTRYLVVPWQTGNEKKQTNKQTNTRYWIKIRIIIDHYLWMINVDNCYGGFS